MPVLVCARRSVCAAHDRCGHDLGVCVIAYTLGRKRILGIPEYRIFLLRIPTSATRLHAYFLHVYFPSAAMAKKRSVRRRNPRFQAVKVHALIDIGALATGVALKGALWDLAQDCRVISADLTWTIFGMDLLDGPVDVGLAHGDYTVAEIAEAMDASPNSDSDKIAIEKSNRQTRLAGTFQQPVNTGAGQVLNNGRKIRTKMGWYFSKDIDLVLFAINRGSPALTVDTTVSVSGMAYLVWA